MINQINELKKEYHSTRIPKHLEEKGFEDVMDRVNKKGIREYLFSPTFVIAIILFLVISTTAITIVQAAKPGTPLHLIKIAAQDIVTKIAGIEFDTDELEEEIDHDFLPTIERIDIEPEETDDDETESEEENEPNHGSDDRSSSKNSEEENGKSQEHISEEGTSHSDKADEQVKGVSDEYRQDDEDKNQGNSGDHRQDGNKQNEKDED